MTDNSLTDEAFHQQTLAGGASRSAVSGNVPDRGFMVGGAANAEGARFPEVTIPVDKFSVDDVRHHARAVRDHFKGQDDVHQGGWREEDKVYLDASQMVPHLTDAVTHMKLRGEKAIYDVRRGKDIRREDTEPGPDLRSKRKASPSAY